MRVSTAAMFALVCVIFCLSNSSVAECTIDALLVDITLIQVCTGCSSCGSRFFAVLFALVCVIICLSNSSVAECSLDASNGQPNAFVELDDKRSRGRIRDV